MNREKIIGWDKNNLLKKMMLAASSIVLLCFIILFSSLNQLQSLNVSDFSALGGIVGKIRTMNTFVNIGLFVAFVGAALVGVDYYIYPKKRILLMKVTSLISFIGAIICFVPLSQLLGTITSAINALSGGNIGSALLYGSDLSNVNPESYSWIVYMSIVTCLVLVVAILSAILLLLKNKEITVSSLAGYIKVKFSKHKKVVIIIACLVVVAGSVFIFTQYVMKTTVDVLTGVEVTFTGVSGDGAATIDKTKIQKTDDAKINDFLSAVNYELSVSEGLENEQVIVITAIPPIEKMEKYKISIPALTKEFTVSGLSTVPQSIEEIPNIEELNSKLIATLEKSGSYSSNNKRSIESVKVCYSPSPKKIDSWSTAAAQYGTYVNVYKITDTYTFSSLSFEPTVTETYQAWGYTNLFVNDKNELNEMKKEFSIYRYGTSTLSEIDADIAEYDLKCA